MNPLRGHHDPSIRNSDTETSPARASAAAEGDARAGETDQAGAKPSAPINAHWKARLPAIQAAIGEAAFRSWLGRSEGQAAVVEFDDGRTLLLSVPTRLMRDHIRAGIAPLIEPVLERRVLCCRRPPRTTPEFQQGRKAWARRIVASALEQLGAAE